MHNFDYSFLETGTVRTSILNLTASVYALRGKTQYQKSSLPRVLSVLETTAHLDSVISSNAIEGVVTTADRAVAIVRFGAAALTHDEAEIAGYNEVLKKITTDFDSMPFDEAEILSMHRILFEKSTAGSFGKYKSEDNVILEYDSVGNKRIRFQPVAAKDTKESMEQLIYAFSEARDNEHINPLVLIPCVILDFLCIHPFKDGNGRISRLLSLLLLNKSGFDVGRYISVEKKINESKELYYTELKASSAGWNENKNDYAPFIEFFLRVIYECYCDLDKALPFGDAALSKSARIEKEVFDAVAPVSKAELCRRLADISPTTVEAVLGRLVRDGRVVKSGAARSTRYFRAEKSR